MTAIRIAVPMFSVARGRYLQATVDGDRSLNPGRATNWKNFGNVKERLCFYSSHFCCQSLFRDFISLVFNDLQPIHRAVVRKMCSPVLGFCTAHLKHWRFRGNFACPKSRREKFSGFSNVQNSRQTLIYRCQAKIASAAGGTLNKDRRAEFRLISLPAEV